MAGKEEKASLEAGTKVSFVVSLQNLVQLGEQIGYSGKELQEFIKQHQGRDAKCTKVLGKSMVWKKELEALLVEIENLVNNRPLTYVTGDQDFHKPLTPAMLMGDIFHTIARIRTRWLT